MGSDAFHLHLFHAYLFIPCCDPSKPSSPCILSSSSEDQSSCNLPLGRSQVHAFLRKVSIEKTMPTNLVRNELPRLWKLVVLACSAWLLDRHLKLWRSLRHLGMGWECSVQLDCTSEDVRLFERYLAWKCSLCKFF